METERLFLKLYEGKDKKHFIGLSTDATVMKYVDQGVLTNEQAEMLWRKLIEDFYPQGINTIWAIFAKENSSYIGHAALRPRPEAPQEWEISYMLGHDEWSKGFATETARGLIKYGFEKLNLPEVFATVKPENQNSIRVLEKAGMVLRSEEEDEGGKFLIFSIRN